MTWRSPRTVLASLGLLLALPAADAVAARIQGRVEGYRGIWPLHVAVLQSRDLSDPANPVAWTTVDVASGTFAVDVPDSLERFYLLAHLDRERMGPHLFGSTLFFLKALPVETAALRGKRLVFRLGDMYLAHAVRDDGFWWSLAIAFALAILLYLPGFLVWRRLRPGPRPSVLPCPRGGPVLWLIAAVTTLPLLSHLAGEPLELLEFTYLHEGLRPATVLGLLFDPISAELSHPPIWPLLMRSLSAVSQAAWWLRLPSLLLHAGLVMLVFRLVAPAAGRRVGLLAGAIAGLLPVAFYYGQDATPYAALAALSAAAAICMLEERWRTFALVLGAGFFIHYTVAVLGVSLALSELWIFAHRRDSGRLRRAMGAYAWVAALPVLWTVHFARTFLASGMSTRLMSVDYLPDPGFLQYVSHFGAVVCGLPPALRWLTPAVLAVVIAGAVHAHRRAPLFARTGWIQLAFLLGYVLFVHVMYMRFAGGRVFYAYRWTSTFLPMVSALAALGVASIFARSRPVGLLAGVLLVGGSLWQDAVVVATPQRPAQSAAVARLEAELQPTDAFAALPAVYYAQLFDYHVHGQASPDLMAWPRWDERGLYGPFHDRNTTIETLATNLAFGRIWVAQYHETMFGTPKFSDELADHQLRWLATHLIPDGRWDYPHLNLFRFRVPPRPDLIWKDGTLELSFHHGLHVFRYFPDLLHTQQTGLAMSAETVRVRLPAPPQPRPAAVSMTVEVQAGQTLQATDLVAAGLELQFSPTPGGGRWAGSVPVHGPLIDLALRRSPEAARRHRTTIIRMWMPAGGDATP